MLLVVDDFEQVSEAATELAQLRFCCIRVGGRIVSLGISERTGDGVHTVCERGDARGWEDAARGPEMALRPVWATVHSTFQRCRLSTPDTHTAATEPVRPKTGQTEWLLLPRVNKELMSLALEHFAKAVGAGSSKQVIILLDQAGWHTSDKVVVPEGINLLFLPSYSPELQPAERLWPLCNEGVANKVFNTIEELEEAVSKRLLKLKQRVVRSVTRFHWCPRAV